MPPEAHSSRSGRPVADGAARLPDVTVYYDGSCPLCTAEIDHYRTRRGGDRLAFVDISRDAAEVGEGLSAEEARRRFHVRLRDGRLASGARAFVEIWRILPGWAVAARIAGAPGVISLLEGGYRLFLPARPVLSRLARFLGAQEANPRSGGE